MPGSMSGLLDLLGVPPDARTFATLDAREKIGQLDAPHRLEPGRALPPPAPVFPRYVEAEPPK
jgi:methionyl-tRNA synthetase